jgi:hypothetical protein
MFCEKCGAKLIPTGEPLSFSATTGEPYWEQVCSRDPCHTRHYWEPLTMKMAFNYYSNEPTWKRILRMIFSAYEDGICKRCGKVEYRMF